MKRATMSGMCSTFLTLLSLEGEMILKEKHTKSKKKIVVKTQKKVCFTSIYFFLASFNLYLLQQDGGINASRNQRDTATGGGENLSVDNGYRLVEDFKQMRYGFISFLHSLGLCDCA